MAGAFNDAWILLKNRGFEVDPRYEDQRLEDLQTTRDDIDTLRDQRAKVVAEINRLSQLGTPESDAKIQQLVEGGHTSPLAHEMFPGQSLPTGGYTGGGLRDLSDEMHFLTDFDADVHGPPYFNTAMLEPYTGAMFQEQQRQEAMEREAMGRPSTVYDIEHGFDRSDFADGYFPFEPTEKPPADIGRAGSIVGEGRPNLRELYFGSNNQTPAAKNEFITADDFMKPPVKKSFEDAWSVLKALDTQDLRQAARTGGLRETPERKQVYRDVGMPYNAPPMLQTIRDARFGMADITPASHTGSQRDAESLMESQKSNFAFKDPALDRTQPLGTIQRRMNLHPSHREFGKPQFGSHQPAGGQYSELHFPETDQGDILHPDIMADPEFEPLMEGPTDEPVMLDDVLEGQPAPSAQEMPSSEPFDIFNRRAESERARQELVAQRRQEMMSSKQPTQPVTPQINQSAQSAAMQALIARQKELGLRDEQGNFINTI